MPIVLTNQWEKAESSLISLVLRILGNLLANFSANFDGKIFREFFGLVFPGFHPPPPKKNSHPELSAFLSNFAKIFREFFGLVFQDYRPPPPPKFTPRIVGIPISLSRTQHFFTPISAYWGDQSLRGLKAVSFKTLAEPVLKVFLRKAPALVQRFTQRMDLRERSGVTCVNLHFRSVGVTCVNLCSLPQDLRA